ncbi:MAG: DNA-protecting protein DprA [Deltaproteobacteria bacterium]|nr:DNA-protecting protein DprA [Deltaproteobacteria bacterium]
MDSRSVDTVPHTQWRDWIALRAVRGVGNVTYRELLERFATPHAALHAPVAALIDTGVHPTVAQAISTFDQWKAVDVQVEKLLQKSVRLVTRGDKNYPVNLTHLHDPPPFLYVRGTLLPEDRVAIAIVGSRVASSYGRGMAQALAHGLAERGVTVVSGLARGIDGEAHRSTLMAGGRTVAVLGSGVDVIYPSEHRGLAEDITKSGAVVSEFSLGTKPDAMHFPYRNRVISGLTLGTVVVEATEKSGSLITARCALEQNREVFAVPGPASTGRSQGPHRLIKEGAKLVETVDDILSEIAPTLVTRPLIAPTSPPLTLDPDEERLLGVLDGDPIHVDVVIAKSGLSAARVLELLLGLELKGAVTQLPGTHFALTSNGLNQRKKRL